MSGALEKACKELTKRVMGRAGIGGTAVSERNGKPCLVVYATEDPPKGLVPREVRGFPVVVERGGPFRAL